MKRRLGTALVASGATLVLMAAPALAAGGALAGEALTGTGQVFNDYPTNGSNPPGCDPQGTSVIAFTQSGPAAGPYPGTYTEQVRLTIGPQAAAGSARPGQPAVLVGPVLSFHSDFTITSPLGQVTGSKDLAPAVPGSFIDNMGSCFGASSPVGSDFAYPYLSDFTFDNRSATVLLRYAATVRPTTGSAFSDSGTALARFDEGRFTGTCTGGTDPGTIAFCDAVQQNSGTRHIDNFFYSQSGFEEFFLVSNGTAPLLPTAAGQCKKDGYKQYLVFKNQGDCVSFVATEGKNPPALPSL